MPVGGHLNGARDLANKSQRLPLAPRVRKADDVVKPVTHKLKPRAAVRCTISGVHSRGPTARCQVWICARTVDEEDKRLLSSASIIHRVQRSGPRRAP